jgi:two-component system chemotaxis response regulator CheY
MASSEEKRGGMRVLVVDDMISMRKIVRKLLNTLGFTHITEARDASEAVGKLQIERFDLIISDWNMPTMSGHQLLEYVRSNRRHGKVPFVMLTVQADKQSVLAAKESGVSHYLAKPFTAGELERKLKEVFRETDTGCIS